MRFRSKPVEIEAMQFPDLSGPTSVRDRRKLHLAHWLAEQAEKHDIGFSFDGASRFAIVWHKTWLYEHALTVRYGDWIVIGPDGSVRKMKDAAFKTAYEIPAENIAA